MTPSANSEISDLLPCPFCGAPAELTVQATNVVRITCSDWKSCGMFPQIKDVRPNAVAAWNRRSANSAGGGVEVKAESLLAIRDALLADDLNEAYHQLYMIADPAFCEMEPWRNLEHKASLHPTEGAEPVASVDHHAYRVAHVACPNFIADPCGSSKCAGCGKRRAEHTRSSPVSAEVTELTVDEVERIIIDTEPPSHSDHGDKVWTRRMAVALAARLSSINGGRG